MGNKKTKLTLSGIAKKSIKNIELAKTQSKNTVVIQKKTSRFGGKSSFNRSSDQSHKQQKKSFFSPKPTKFSKPQTPINNNFEKRKLAEQRATRRVKGELSNKDPKAKLGSKKRELKLTISRALNDEIETRSRSLASLKRAKQKENRDINKKDTQENFKPIKRNVNIPESITVRDLANRMAEQSSSLIKHLLGMGVTVTINQSLAADTAEYLVKEFGHHPIRESKQRK